MTRTSATTRSRARQAGMTLVELLLAMSSTAMIGAAIAAMLAAVSYGTSSEKNMRSLVVRNKLINARFSAAIRDAQMVLEAGDNYIVLWRVDTNESETSNLGEIQWIELDTGSSQIRSYKADFSGMTQAQIDAANTEFTLAADFDAATSAVRGTAVFPAEIWAGSTTGWTVTVNDNDEQQATLVSFRFQIEHADMSDTLIGAAALRNR